MSVRMTEDNVGEIREKGLLKDKYWSKDQKIGNGDTNKTRSGVKKSK